MPQKQIETLAWGITTLGALISSISILEYSGGHTKSSFSGLEYHFALLSPHGLMLGNAFFIAGLALQFIERLDKEDKLREPKFFWTIFTVMIVALIELQVLLRTILFI